MNRKQESPFWTMLRETFERMGKGFEAANTAGEWPGNMKLPPNDAKPVCPCHHKHS